MHNISSKMSSFFLLVTVNIEDGFISVSGQLDTINLAQFGKTIQNCGALFFGKFKILI